VEQEKSHRKLAFEATTHCLTGCGIGDIVGVIVGTALGIAYFQRVGLGLIFGLFFGFLLGLYPLFKAKIPFNHAFKIILTTEIFSILAMEAAEGTTELLFPGMRRMGLAHFQYWLGLTMALFAGFVVAYPVNLFLVKRGVRHQH